MPLIRKLIRCDGTSKALPPGMSLSAIRELIGAADGLDTVPLHHLGEPLHVMLVDDRGYDFEVIQHSPGHFEHRATHARKPLNPEATRLYHMNCKPGVTHQIVGDVVVVPDLDFA